ncbi:uncharacterized protein LOC110853311 isoform X2 [Folsomia candida]|uniref:uncharacterized protein LOC110853311 isoform X2 n=1 Tax=Folsomia candida TaxID=158441 RepID=UPI00160520CA|nr:uncharacterized protein LOC110853311 isoform X2 [Folsomia candida]
MFLKIIIFLFLFAIQIHVLFSCEFIPLESLSGDGKKLDVENDVADSSYLFDFPEVVGRQRRRQPPSVFKLEEHMNHHELPKIDDDGPKNENHIDMDDTDVKELARGGVRASIQQPLNKINNLESEDPGCPLSPIILWGTAISLIFSIGIQLQTYSMLRFTVKMCLRRFAPRNFTLTDCDWSLERELEDPEKLLDVSRKIILSDQIDLESTQLGAGFFGSVFPAKVTVGSAYVTAAVKRIKCSYPSAAQLNSLLNEAEKLDLVGKHHHVLEFLGVCIQNVLQVTLKILRTSTV